MGLGKTYIATYKANELNLPVLVVCQKSKIKDWEEFLEKYSKVEYEVINYDKIFRRPNYLAKKDYTLVLDESSYIKNETAKRTKFILQLNFTNVILLSGTPISGKYEHLLTQMKLLGCNMSRAKFYQKFTNFQLKTIGYSTFYDIISYKNIDKLKELLTGLGVVFMSVDDVVDLNLPNENFIVNKIKRTKEYRTYIKDKLVKVKDIELVGDSPLKRLLHQRQLCSIYNQNKLKALEDIFESTNDRILIFYNFKEEYQTLYNLCLKMGKPMSYINGLGVDLNNYNKHDNTIVLCQYQSSALGHNLQLANYTVYYSLTLSSELFEQSKARTRRIGQNKPCYYYLLLTENSVEEKIYEVLQEKQDYTIKLFEK